MKGEEMMAKGKMKKKNIFGFKLFRFFLLFLTGMVCIGVFAFGPGSEFQVNTYTLQDQQFPVIAMDERDNFVVAWQSRGQDGSRFSVYAQRYGKKGQMLGTEFLVNTNISRNQQSPTIAMNKKGSFVIAWESQDQDGSGYGIYVQRFNKNGKSLGSEFRVNTYTPRDQQFPAVGMDERGNFVVAWQSRGQDRSGYDVYAQRFNGKGKSLGSEFRVNTYTLQNQQFPVIAMDERGSFVIAWESQDQDGSGYGVYAQRFNKGGKSLGSEFQVNTYTLQNQRIPAIAMDERGNFVISWESMGRDGWGYGICAQRFNKNGLSLGPEIQVNDYKKNNQRYAVVAMDKKGSFVIAWESQGQDGSEHGVYVQRFDKNGQPKGSEQQVNTYTKNDQQYPAISINNDEQFVCTWESKGQDGSHMGIFAKLLKVQTLSPPTLISPKKGAVLDNGRTDRRDPTIWDFDWSNVSGATKFQLYVIHTGAKYPVINTTISRSSYHYENYGYIIDSNRFNWKWKVRAGDGSTWSDWSKERSFVVEPVNTDPPSTLSPPTLISPTKGALMDNGRTDRRDPTIWDFDWSNVSGATKYQLYVIHTGAKYPVINTTVSSSSYHYENYGYIIDSNRFSWKWKVRAGDGSTWSNWSEELSFDIEPVNTDLPSALSPPTLISPTKGALMDNGRTDKSDPIIWDFDWSNVSGATEYQLYVIHTGAKYPVINTTVSSSSYHHVSYGYIIDSNRFNWKWKVRAGDGSAWSNWSEERSFVVEPVNTD